MLNEEIIRYSILTGKDYHAANKTPVCAIGSYLDGYKKAIDDYNKILKQRSIKMSRKVSTEFFYKIVYHKAVGTNEIDKIAEQLKGGVVNR